MTTESAPSGSAQCPGCGAELVARRCGRCGVAAEVGSYRIQAVIAESPHGRIYRALAADGATVAIKELTFATVPSREQLEAFSREAELLQQLHHPHIPAFYARFEEGEGPELRLYLAQELIVGPSAQARLEKKLLTESEAKEVARQLLETLSYLHRLSPKVIHRDIKPANVILRGNEAVLVDFGSARDLSGGVTYRSTLVGTFGYMAPEQLGGTVVPSSDLYALGATLAHLVTGRAPAESFVYGEGVRVPDLLGLSPEFRAFVERLAAYRMEDRFASAQDAAAALAYLGSIRFERPRPTRRGVWALAAGVAVTTGVGAWRYAHRADCGLHIGYYCGNDQLKLDPNTLYFCSQDAQAQTLQACELGCETGPDGPPDRCRTPTPASAPALAVAAPPAPPSIASPTPRPAPSTPPPEGWTPPPPRVGRLGAELQDFYTPLDIRIAAADLVNRSNRNSVVVETPGCAEHADVRLKGLRYWTSSPSAQFDKMTVPSGRLDLTYSFVMKGGPVGCVLYWNSEFKGDPDWRQGGRGNGGGPGIGPNKELNGYLSVPSSVHHGRLILHPDSFGVHHAMADPAAVIDIDLEKQSIRSMAVVEGEVVEAKTDHPLVSSIQTTAAHEGLAGSRVDGKFRLFVEPGVVDLTWNAMGRLPASRTLVAKAGEVIPLGTLSLDPRPPPPPTPPRPPPPPAVVPPGLIGVQLEQLSTGVRIHGVFPKGPAESAGIAAGDIVTSVDSQPVVDLADMMKRVRGAPGSEVSLTLTRDGRPYSVQVHRADAGPSATP